MAEASDGATPTLIVVGSAARDVDPADPRGWRLGGGVTYGALAAARLGLRIGALVGVDAAAAEAHELDLLREAGVEVVLARLAHSPVFENVERPDGRIQTCLDPGEPVPLDALPASWREAPAWLLAPVAGEVGPAWAGVPPPDACVAFGWQGILRDLRAGQRVRPVPPGPSPLLLRAGLIGASRHDLMGEIPVSDLIAWLSPGDELLITAGEHGGILLALGDDRVTRLRSYPGVPAGSAVDATGAGDVMLASTLAARVVSGDRGHTSDRDLLVGAAAASLTVEEIGLAAVPTLAAVRERLASWHATRSPTPSPAPRSAP